MYDDEALLGFRLKQRARVGERKWNRFLATTATSSKGLKNMSVRLGNDNRCVSESRLRLVATGLLWGCVNFSDHCVSSAKYFNNI